MPRWKGCDLVTTDGNTLLGADDKAGIAIIMSALEFFHKHPEIKHHNISVAFTVDEEIGEGSKFFSLKEMDADYAFTVDGALIDCVDYENFNAKGFEMDIHGIVVHPGEGKDKLINAVLVMNDFINMMPKNDTPFEAGPDDGYWHINGVSGGSDKMHLDMILRDFCKEKLENRVEIIKNNIETLLKKYPGISIEYKFVDQYENMRPFVDKNPKPVEIAKAALKKNGLEPKSTKIRGGTDGAAFSKMGLVTPNLGTGSYNHHGRYEFLVIQEFEKMIDVVIDILKI